MIRHAVSLLFLLTTLSLCVYPKAQGEETPLTQTFTAVADATVWPNLTRLSDGTLLLAGFEEPSHGQVEGDVGCWVSDDEGLTWKMQGTLTEHAPKTVRMNQAVGLDADGKLIALVGGWTDVQQPDAPKRNIFRDAILRPWVCQSDDGGKTWRKHENFPADELGRELVAFGDIVVSDEGRLNASAYATLYYDKPGKPTAYFLVSEDGGASWKVRAPIAEGHNECSLLYLGDGEWLAAVRASGCNLFRSTDDGATWTQVFELGERKQHPAHLLKLKDGRIVVTFGDRRPGHFGIRARISEDKGETWSAPHYVATMPEWDGGYPASVERADGTVLTLFYSKSGESYSVQGAVWSVPE